MTISAKDEFWLSPTLADTGNNDANDDDHDNDDSPMELIIPPAHHQLLSTDPASIKDLKGYDHSRDHTDCDDDVDSYATSFCSRQKPTEAKQQGGGLWLLGLACLTNAVQRAEELTPPGLVRAPSGSSLDFDENWMSDSDGESIDPATLTKKRPRGVCFSETVTIQPIPHSCTLTPMQRRKMYSTSMEVRHNKIRNKKEYRYDGYNWRNVTEEWEMGVNVVTGELVHPVHEHRR